MGSDPYACEARSIAVETSPQPLYSFIDYTTAIYYISEFIYIYEFHHLLYYVENLKFIISILQVDTHHVFGDRVLTGLEITM